MLAVVETTAIRSFTLDIIYDLQDGIYGYEALFVDTLEGVQILPMVVPTKAKFIDILQRLQAVRGNKPGCSIDLEITADIEGDCWTLLEASYEAPHDDTTLTAALPTWL